MPSPRRPPLLFPRLSSLFLGWVFLLIFALFIAGLVHLAVSHSGTHTLRQNMSSGGDGGGAALVLGTARAIVPCLWAFDGWADLGSLAEEMRFPERDLPLVILFSISIVAGLYLLCNVAYFAVLDQDAIIDADAVAIDFSNALGGGVVGRAAVVMTQQLDSRL